MGAQAQTTAPDGGALSPATSTVCAGSNAGTLTLSGYTGTIVKYQSNSGNGYVDIANTTPTYTFSNLPGTISFRVIVQNGTNAPVASSVATVTVAPVPSAIINAQGPTTFCSGGSVMLVTSTGTDLTYQFLNNGQPISGATSASYTALLSGSYSVVVTTASGCASTSAGVSVTVNPATSATFSYPAAGFCQNTSGTIVPTVTGTTGGTFSSAAGLTLNATTGAVTPATSTAGPYTVTYSVAGTCASSSTFRLGITPLAVATFSYTPANYCTTGGTARAKLSMGSTAGTFSAPTGLSLNAYSGAVTLTTSTTGTYIVTNTVPARNGCPAATATSTITVNPRPAQPGLTFAGGVLSTPVVTGNTYQYYLNGNAIAGATSSTFTPLQSGSYTVLTTSAAGCSSPLSTPVTVTVTATRTGEAAFALAVFPTPTTGQLMLQLNGAHSTTALRINNALGQVVWTGTLPATASAQELNLSALAPGVYVLRATALVGTVALRVVRQ